MTPILVGSILLSLLHAVIPNHWLPILAIAKKEGWTDRETLGVTFVAASAHVFSTVLIGFAVAWLGLTFGHEVEHFTHVVAPILLILLGSFFIWQHYRHHHFHLHDKELQSQHSKPKLILALAAMMFLSPCMEIEALFLSAGEYGWVFVGLIALVYAVVTIVGMLVWVFFALWGLSKMDWHRIEHNAGLLTGAILAITGLVLLLSGGH